MLVAPEFFVAPDLLVVLSALSVRVFWSLGASELLVAPKLRLGSSEALGSLR
jgi:hypothetical protein